MGNQRPLFRCPSPKEQKPVYYVSRALADVETRYSKMELTALALRSAAQKLRPYFQAHPVIVLTDQPLRSILHKPDLTGRMLQWAIELSEFGIEFQPRLSKKGQVMADFVLEYSRRPNQHHESSEQEWWTLRVDGASRSSGSGVGLVLQSPTGEHLEQAIRLGFSASNNEAEYEAILSGLDLALALSVSKLRIYSDSQLVVRHMSRKNMRLRTHAWRDTWPNCPFHPDGGTCTSDPSQGLIFAVLGIQRPMGHGHSGTPPSSTCPKEIPLVATDYFSKWVEAEAYASIKDKDVTKFHCIQEFLFGIEYPEFILHATLSSKQWPGGSHKQNSNQCLKEKAGASQREVGGGATRRPMGLSNHTRTTNRKYSFCPHIWNGCIIPTEIGLPTIRTDAAKQKDANTELGRNLDWADEVRESASIRMADYQQRASAHYNRKVRPRNFKNGTLVLRKVFENTAEVGAGKFQANWEGPYIVSKANENGAYHLQKLDGTPLLRPWNVFNLKQYYQ
ncbi:hypothetical protein CK203_030150 [Vitis vinifera]|uniref:Uncharacterized protein n=1 Tax=Vitis vinifera TaxID=29760 RepID=A0A438I5I0_VITVI|nr:hypothetical protein CK203_030150 [Vitis vinifera]